MVEQLKHDIDLYEFCFVNYKQGISKSECPLIYKRIKKLRDFGDVESTGDEIERLLRVAVGRGNVEAKVELGKYLLEKGRDGEVEKRREEVVALLREAVIAGNMEAIDILDSLVQDG